MEERALGFAMKQELKLVSFIGQKGGVGKSALARLLSVGAAREGRKVLLADFDLDQLTCLEWNATRLRRNIEPEIDVRSFKSMKKLRKTEESFDLIVADTRGHADDLTKDVAEESSVVFLPTGTSVDDLRPTLALAQRLAKHGADGKIMFILSKTGRSERQVAAALKRIEAQGFPILAAAWGLRDGLQSEFDFGRVGLESANRYLRDIAEQVGRAMMERIFPSEGASPP
ncbi:MAG TPA: ParA family protein [Methylovirgula sp.]|nr:ParA family protein [Methylovirgula sp.]